MSFVSAMFSQFIASLASRAVLASKSVKSSKANGKAKASSGDAVFDG